MDGDAKRGGHNPEPARQLAVRDASRHDVHGIIGGRSKMYRLDRWYYTVYGAQAYERPMFVRSFIVAWAVKMVCGLWWEVYLERVD